MINEQVQLISNFQSVQAIVTDAGVPPWNKLRIVMLYALRYQKTQTSNIASLINLLLANGVSREDAKVCPFSGSSVILMRTSLSVGLCSVKCRRCGSTTRRPLFNRVIIGQGSFSIERSQGSGFTILDYIYAHPNFRVSKTFTHNILPIYPKHLNFCSKES